MKLIFNNSYDTNKTINYKSITKLEVMYELNNLSNGFTVILH